MSYFSLLFKPGDTGSTALGTTAVGSSSTSKITIFGLTMLIIYATTSILNFYGVGVDKYGSYLVFYIFLIICANILDTDYPKI
jgi:hypothetical protein